MLKQTALNQIHHALGAKMVDFGGWEMPLHYGSQVEEHHLVRQSAGMFDVSHMRVIDIEGQAAHAFLQQLLANNVDKLVQPGKALYSCLLNSQGGVIDDLIVYFIHQNQFRLVVNAGTAEKDLDWLMQQQQQLVLPLKITPRTDLAIIAIQGPQARQKVWQALPGSESVTGPLKPFYATQFDDYFIARTGYTGEDGFEIILPHTLATLLWSALHDLGVRPIGLGARDTLRLEAGMNLYGQDMDESTSPLESGLAWTIDLNGERTFIGKQALLTQTPTQHLLGLLLLDKGVLRAHQAVHTPHGQGEITSGSFSPTLNQSIALARLPNQVQIGEHVQVEIRGKLLAAKVVKYPFVRHGKVCSSL